MRIIDKNTDYYDYLQNSDDPIVFDRRGSYLLTKDHLDGVHEIYPGQEAQPDGEKHAGAHQQGQHDGPPDKIIDVCQDFRYSTG